MTEVESRAIDYFARIKKTDEKKLKDREKRERESIFSFK